MISLSIIVRYSLEFVCACVCVRVFTFVCSLSFFLSFFLCVLCLLLLCLKNSVSPVALIAHSVDILKNKKMGQKEYKVSRSHC